MNIIFFHTLPYMCCSSGIFTSSSKQPGNIGHHFIIKIWWNGELNIQLSFALSPWFATVFIPENYKVVNYYIEGSKVCDIFWPLEISVYRQALTIYSFSPKPIKLGICLISRQPSIGFSLDQFAKNEYIRYLYSTNLLRTNIFDIGICLVC